MRWPKHLQNNRLVDCWIYTCGLCNFGDANKTTECEAADINPLNQSWSLTQAKAAQHINLCMQACERLHKTQKRQHGRRTCKTL